MVDDDTTLSSITDLEEIRNIIPVIMIKHFNVKRKFLHLATYDLLRIDKSRAKFQNIWFFYIDLELSI